MAGELKIGSNPGLTVYAHIISSAGKLWNGSTFETYASSDWSSYTVPMSEQGSSGVYIGDFPSITTADTYEIFYFYQVGGSKAEGDVLVGTGSIAWSIATAATTSTGTGSGINFLQMQQELSDRVGAYDSTISGDATKLKRWLNMAQQDITGRQNWPFMLAHAIIQTLPDITSGTVSVASGSTSLTFSVAPTVTATDFFIKFSGDNNWYKIASHTASSTSATITPSYGGSSNLSGSAYTLRKLFYGLGSPGMDSVLDIKKTATGRFLESASSRDTDVFLPLYWDTGEIYKYISSIPNSAGGARVSFLYSPSTAENLQVRGIKPLSDMSADTDVPLIPSRWRSAIIDLASFYAFSSLDDTRATDFFNRSEKIIQAMVETYDGDLGRARTTRSLSTGILEGPAYVLPPQYGVNQS